MSLQTDGKDHVGSDPGKRGSTGAKRATLEHWREAVRICDDAKLRGKPEFPTGLECLDSLTGGVHRGEVWTVSGRPGSGKTSLALEMAASFADDPSHVLLFSSLEMRGWELVLRMFSEMFGVEYFKLLTGQATFTDQQKQVFEEYLGRINLDVEEFGYSFGDIDKALETTYAKKAPDVIFVDFIQLIDWRAIGDERIALMEYIRQAKQLAKKFNVAFVIVSQLRRPPTGADCNRPPELTDLFGSGSLEQLSDKVIFCYREIDDSQKSTRHFINLAKNRQGPTGKSEVNFDGRFYRFTDIKEDDYARKVRLALDGKVE